jgi:hypothetical protein
MMRGRPCTPFFCNILKAIHASTYPITEEQTNRFTVVRAPYAFCDGRADI